MRSAELALLLIPAFLIAAWLYGVRGLSTRGTIAVLALLACLAATLLYLRLDHAFTGHYVPARLNGTHILPGHPA